MKCSGTLLSLAAALPAVQAVAFIGPTPTAISPALALLEGTSPKPTIPPSNDELKKRQTNTSPESCGWIDGVYSLGVTCPGSRSCMIFTSGAIGMQGCCNGVNTIDCGWATSCVDSVAFESSQCGSACQANAFIRKCTAATAAYCASWTFDNWSVTGYGCAAYEDSVLSTIFDHATDAFGATTSMSLPTAAANILDVDTDSTTRKTAKKLAIGVIVGIVVVALFIIFCIAIGILYCIKKKRKNAQIATSTQAMAAVQSTRPQSQFQPTQPQYPPVQQQQQQQYQYPTPQQQQQPSLFQPSIEPQNPSTTTSYFPPGVGQHEEKPNTYTSVHEYATTPVSPPISSPSTPAPVYSQPHGVPPPMPVSVASQYQVPPAPEAHEVDAVSVPHAPGRNGPVHEIGSGK